MRLGIAAAMFRLVALTLATLALLAPSLWGQELATAPPRPRLVVLVVIDQLRGDYLERWKDLFAVGGFRRLQKNGVWFQNCHYPYASTFTGPGHASLVTGCSPDKHGIVMNDWFDRISGASVYCVASDHYHRVPSPPASIPNSQTRTKSDSVSPEHLLAPAIGDALKEATAGKGRVVSLSLKDRSAILMGGRHPDICYWFDTSKATVVTSSYYAEGLRPWAESNSRAGTCRLADAATRRRGGIWQERAGGGRAPTGSFRRSYREVFPSRAVRRCRHCHQALLLND